ncbi:polygalacturonase-like [Vigna unguiculata]|uniref:polygalacturonase-like n=1 Tax=Vigna unguiculata TaxID=3917 RepID=UPI0010161CB3|nr:polygalacturonase-like [Vigna unguiculata]
MKHLSLFKIASILTFTQREIQQTMALPRHQLFLFLVAMFVSFADSTVPEDPLRLFHQASPKDKNFIMQSTQHVLKLKSFGKLGLVSSSLKMVNVNDYGAHGDGKTDDTLAFKKAWKVACSSAGAVFVVPQKSYVLKPITFSGPCKSNIAVQISGTLEASDNPSDYSGDRTHWIMFHSVQKLSVNGGGTIDGNGNIWWQNSCKRNHKLPCKKAPTALTFYRCNYLTVEDLTIKNGQQMHVSFEESKNVIASGLTVTAPEDSPNTDGIHITNTQNIQILNTVIGTGDDCISIESGSTNVQATKITCGPGHGISIGSLGSGKSKDFVSGVTINGAKFSGTTNGVRIKTWQGGSGSASNIKFQNIEMDKVMNPIIIDQNYCDQATPCKKQKSAVEIRNVLYENIKGTSASDVGVQFECSEKFPCKGIVLQNVELEREDGEGAKASCNSVQLSYIGDVNPQCP